MSLLLFWPEEIPDEFTGTAAVAAQPATVAAAGGERFDGAAAVSSALAAQAGSAELVFGGPGATAATPAMVAGSGGQAYAGAGALVPQPAQASAMGEESFLGSSVAEAQPAGLSGQGGQTFSGPAAAAAAAALVGAQGGQAFIGDGALVGAPANVFGGAPLLLAVGDLVAPKALVLGLGIVLAPPAQEAAQDPSPEGGLVFLPLPPLVQGAGTLVAAPAKLAGRGRAQRVISGLGRVIPAAALFRATGVQDLEPLDEEDLLLLLEVIDGHSTRDVGEPGARHEPGGPRRADEAVGRGRAGAQDDHGGGAARAAGEDRGGQGREAAAADAGGDAPDPGAVPGLRPEGLRGRLGGGARGDRQGLSPLTARQAAAFAIIRHDFEARRGRPVSAAFVADMLGVSHERARAIFRRLNELGWLRSPGTPAIPSESALAG